MWVNRHFHPSIRFKKMVCVLGVLGKRVFLGSGFKYFFFHPHLGKIPSLTDIFQMG